MASSTPVLQTYSNYTFNGLQLNLNPMLQRPSQLIRSVNLETYPFGAIRKRKGYSAFLGTPDNQQITQLFDWHRGDGTTFNLYRVSGSVLYLSPQGTGAWTPATGGTFQSSNIGYTVAYDQTARSDYMIIGDGVGTSKYSTDGTTFQVGTAGIPISSYFSNYQGRVWAGGTSSTMFYSTTFSPLDWVTDSSNIAIPGPGNINSLFKSSDRLVITKNSGNIFRYDGFNLLDTATKLGPSSTMSIGEVEDNKFWLNRYGFFSYAGDKPILKSNPVERQVYNNSGSAIVGTVFNSAPGVCHYYDYYCAVGTVTDDLTNQTVSNCVMKYNFQKDDWSNYSLADNPTAFHSFTDNNGNQQLIFGDSTGQVYKFDSSLSDNGKPITAIGEMIIHLGNLLEKEFKWLALSFNPGCQAVIQVATADAFNKDSLKWMDLGDVSSGKIEFHFPQNSRGTYLRLKFIESSKNTAFNFYGFECNYYLVPRE